THLWAWDPLRCLRLRFDARHALTAALHATAPSALPSSSVRIRISRGMSGSCAVGDLQGCRDDACIDAMLGFGRHFGIGYQLLDDLLDLTATAEQLGKPVGNDIREGIYTLPLLRALQRDPALRPLLRPEITDAEIAEVLGRVRTGEAVEKVLTLVAQHVDLAVTTSVRPTAPAPVPVSQQRSRTSPAPSSPARP
ncbi:polyprenyl synthetase family protein, partial [Streptomyces decoyicus]